MIGDWIYAIDSEGNKHPCRANNLQYDYINKRDDFCVDFYGTDYEPEWPDITYDTEPIPLTDEILEKNGFNKIQCINKLANPSYFYRLTITETHEDKTYDTWVLEAQNRGDVFEIDGDFEYDEILQGEVMNYKAKYVHKLQHIMRLLKFPKDIEL